MKTISGRGDHKGRLWGISTVLFTILFAITMVGGPIANNYATIINMVLGVDTGTTTGGSDSSGQNYYEADYSNS